MSVNSMSAVEDWWDRWERVDPWWLMRARDFLLGALIATLWCAVYFTGVEHEAEIARANLEWAEQRYEEAVAARDEVGRDRDRLRTKAAALQAAVDRQQRR